MGTPPVKSKPPRPDEAISRWRALNWLRDGRGGSRLSTLGKTSALSVEDQREYTKSIAEYKRFLVKCPYIGLHTVSDVAEVTIVILAEAF